ncbi:MAG TPA: universal stress protein [Planctomycetota bacterium]|nr:universal stress protein [Planctomycetota bacterium]
MPQKVLVALDGSPEAEESIPWARALADPEQIVLLQVVKRGASDSIHLIHTDHAARDARRYLQQVAKERLPGASTETRLGSVASAILLLAEELDARLIVVTRRGAGGMGKALLGGTTENLIHAAERPILVVPVREEGPLAGTRIGSVVVPLDGSEASESVLPLARSVGRRTGATVTLLHVLPDSLGLEEDLELLRESGLESETIRAMITKVEAEGERRKARLREAAEGLVRAGVRAETRLLSGKPETEIAKFVRKEAADMILMSAHGYGAVGRLLLGSVACKLIGTAKVPVLVTQRAAVPEIQGSLK